MTTVAVTGATGFLGGALIDTLLTQGATVRALARDPKRLRRADDVEVIVGDIENDAALRDLARGADAFIHLAGVTHAKAEQDYRRINVEGTARAARAAEAAGARLVHASSLTARRPAVSPYAASKRESEDVVAEICPAGISLRLPALYGPGDMATLPYFKLIRRGLALEPSTETPARASLLFVDDAAHATAAAAASTRLSGVFEVGDDEIAGRTWTEIGRALAQALDVEVKPLRAPKPAVELYYHAMRAAETAFGRSPTLRQGQTNEFFHPDWVARDNLFNRAAPWTPTTSLKEGFAKAVEWYQERKLI